MTALRFALARAWAPLALRSPQAGFWLLALGVASLVAAIALAAAVGTARLPLGDTLRILLDALPIIDLPQRWSDAHETILLDLRLPRVIAAALVGAALGAAGTIFQGVFRNPMADPYVIGISSGAAFAAVLGFLIFPSPGFLFFGFSWVPFLAFLGALATVLLVYLLAQSGGRTPMTTLLLAGVAVGALLISVQSFLMLSQSDSQFRLGAIFAWLLGGVATVGWGQFALLAPFVAVGLLLARAFAYPLNALALGEEQAGVLGVPVEGTKLALVVAASLMTAAAVAAAGLVGFVGLVVPHVMRLLVGPDHRRLLWVSALYGAVFMVLMDLLARTILSPQEVPVGLLTAFVGAPVFLFLLRRAQGRYEF